MYATGTRRYETLYDVPIDKFRHVFLRILRNAVYVRCYRITLLMIDKINKTIWRLPFIKSMGISHLKSMKGLRLQRISNSYLKSTVTTVEKNQNQGSSVVNVTDTVITSKMFLHCLNSACKDGALSFAYTPSLNSHGLINF